jgi:hypothetical protein
MIFCAALPAHLLRLNEPGAVGQLLDRIVRLMTSCKPPDTQTARQVLLCPPEHFKGLSLEIVEKNFDKNLPRALQGTVS